MSIFVSYARANLAIVESLTDGLKAAGFDVWFDQELTPGDVWWERILGNIRDCSLFLFALSDESSSSKACRTEREYAEQLGRPVLPVAVAPIQNLVQNPVGSRQIVQYRTDAARSAFAIVGAVSAMTSHGIPPLPNPLPKPPEMPLAYLVAISSQLNETELSYENQLAIVDELRRKLEVETGRDVHQLIFETLRSLRAKPYASTAVVGKIDNTFRDLKVPTEPSNEAPDPPGSGWIPDVTERDHRPNDPWWLQLSSNGKTSVRAPTATLTTPDLNEVGKLKDRWLPNDFPTNVNSAQEWSAQGHLRGQDAGPHPGPQWYSASPMHQPPPAANPHPAVHDDYFARQAHQGIGQVERHDRRAADTERLRGASMVGRPGETNPAPTTNQSRGIWILVIVIALLLVIIAAVVANQ